MITVEYLKKEIEKIKMRLQTKKEEEEKYKNTNKQYLFTQGKKKET